MDSDRKSKKKEDHRHNLSHSRNILQSLRIRRFVRTDNETDRVLLDYGFNFLLPLGIILWAVLASYIL